MQKIVRALGLPLSAVDQTFAFIKLIRAQMDAGECTPASSSVLTEALSSAERERRLEIAEIASEGGRFASRLTRLMLELLSQGSR